MVRRKSLVNRHSLLLAGLSLLLSFIYLSFNVRNDYYTGLLATHGEIGYNVWRYNSIKVNRERLGHVLSLHTTSPRRTIDYSESDHLRFGPPTHYRSIGDTVGYGVLLGLLWKLTGSLRYVDVQILQAFLLSLMLLLLYSIALSFFQNKKIALLCGVAHLLFLPIYYQNAQAMRDIWAYYGVVVLVWLFSYWLMENRRWWEAYAASFFFTVCMWLRAPIILNLIMVTGIVTVMLFLRYLPLRRTVGLLALLWGFNVVCFWVPFVSYNRVAYDRNFVSPLGQDLLEGLWEFENPWGRELGDDGYRLFMASQYGLRYGTPECDETARKVFIQMLLEHPSVFVLNAFRRLPQMILPGLPISNHSNAVQHKQYSGAWDRLTSKLGDAFFSGKKAVDFVFRFLGMRFFILLSYVGILLAILRRRYSAVALVFLGSVLPSYMWIFSHIEYRYVTPFYGLLSLFAGYAAYRILNRFGWSWAE